MVKIPATDDIMRPCTNKTVQITDAMLQLSPHGEIAVPIASKSKSLDQFVKRGGTAPRPPLSCGTRERRAQFIVILILIMASEAISGAAALAYALLVIGIKPHNLKRSA
jgi:hypothetical protein